MGSYFEFKVLNSEGKDETKKIGELRNWVNKKHSEQIADIYIPDKVEGRGSKFYDGAEGHGNVHMLPNCKDYAAVIGIKISSKLGEVSDALNLIKSKKVDANIRFAIPEPILNVGRGAFSYVGVIILDRKYELTGIKFSDNKNVINCDLHAIQCIRHKKNVNYFSINYYPNVLKNEKNIPKVESVDFAPTYYNPDVSFYDSVEAIALKFLMFILESERQYAELLKEEENYEPITKE